MRRLAAALTLFTLALNPACKSREAKLSPEDFYADLESDDLQKAGNARIALIKLGEPAVPRLAEMVATGTPRQQRAAANLLWTMGPQAVGAVPALADAAASPETDLRLAALMALGNVGPAAEPSVPALIKALGDRDPEIRLAAVKALSAIGPGAKAALPTLKRITKLTSWGAAEEAIRRIQGHDDPS